MEPINTSTSNSVSNYQPKKVVAAEPAQPAKPSATAALTVPKFISPNGNIDAKSGTYSIQVRDTSTGEVKSEYPRKIAVQEYNKPAANTETQAAPAPSGGGEPVASGSSDAPKEAPSHGAAANASNLDVKV